MHRREIRCIFVVIFLVHCKLSEKHNGLFLEELVALSLPIMFSGYFFHIEQFKLKSFIQITINRSSNKTWNPNYARIAKSCNSEGLSFNPRTGYRIGTRNSRNKEVNFRFSPLYCYPDREKRHCYSKVCFFMWTRHVSPWMWIPQDFCRKSLYVKRPLLVSLFLVTSDLIFLSTK